MDREMKTWADLRREERNWREKKVEAKSDGDGLKDGEMARWREEKKEEMNKGYKGIGLRMRNSGRNEKMCFVGQVGWVDGQILGGKKEGMKQEHGDVLHMKDMKILGREERIKCQDSGSSYFINVMSDGWNDGEKTDAGKKDRLERWMKKEQGGKEGKIWIWS